MDHRGRPCVSTQTVVTLTKIVTPNAMRQCLCFIYTGQIDTRFCSIQVSPSYSQSKTLDKWIIYNNMFSVVSFLLHPLPHILLLPKNLLVASDVGAAGKKPFTRLRFLDVMAHWEPFVANNYLYIFRCCAGNPAGSRVSGSPRTVSFHPQHPHARRVPQ